MIGSWMQSFNKGVFGEAWMGRTVQLSWEPMLRNLTVEDIMTGTSEFACLARVVLEGSGV